MLKCFSILFVFCSFLNFSQTDKISPEGESKENFFSAGGFPKLYYPEYIPVNSTFDISLIASSSFPEADKLELYIIPSERVYLNKLTFSSVYETKKLGYSSSSSDDYPFGKGFHGTVYKTKIALNDSLYPAGTFFQVLSGFKVENIGVSSIKFYGVFKKGEKVLGSITPAQLTDNTAQDETTETDYDFLTAEIVLYKPQKTADNSILFDGPSSLNIAFKEDYADDLSCEFWLRINDPEISFLKILNKETSSVEYELSANAFQTLSVNSVKNEQKYLDPVFLGKKSWYHIKVVFHFEEDIVDFFCNETLLSKFSLPEFSNPDDLIFNFENLYEKKSFQLDLLRFSDLESAQKKISIPDTSRDSIRSRIISQFKFENSNEILNNRQNIDVDFSSIRIVKSDAPIFALAPELNIRVLGNVYELEWSGGDYKQAASYTLERSKGASYTSVFTVESDNSAEKKYTFLDEKDESSGIVYYRVKQKNIDGTIAYSSQVKVGQGLLEPFIVEQNFPNPFNPKTSIEVELLEDSEIEITIYNLEGREISKLHKGFLAKGVYKFDFDASELTSGIYLYKVATPNYNQTRKMIFTK
jgi:hypothetical protein